MEHFYFHSAPTSIVNIDWPLFILGLFHCFSSSSDQLTDRSKCLRHARWKFVRLEDCVLDQHTSHDFDVPESGMDQVDFFLEAVFYLGSGYRY